MDKSKSTYDHFLEVTAGLTQVDNHITLLARSIQRDEAEAENLRAKVKRLEKELKKLTRKCDKLEASATNRLFEHQKAKVPAE
jgi:predicted RNase H-like nuclease (RuvC/YqgF family)